MWIGGELCAEPFDWVVAPFGVAPFAEVHVGVVPPTAGARLPVHFEVSNVQPQQGFAGTLGVVLVALHARVRTDAAHVTNECPRAVP